MSSLGQDGMLISPKVIFKRFKMIEHGDLLNVHGIVIHQTDSGDALSTFNSYCENANGAHFLIGKDGRIYQTASLNKRCFHIGRFIKSKCIELKGSECKDSDLSKLLALDWLRRVKAIDRIERIKAYPYRFPVNSDSIGVELVGKHIDDKRYEATSVLQNTSLQWLIGELCTLFGTDKDDIYRHPEISYKHPGEAASATWE